MRRTADDRVVAPASGPTTGTSRRGFLGLLGGAAALGTGTTRRASARETPVVRMENNYFDPVGRFVEPGTTVRFELAAGAHSATAYPDRIPAGAEAFDSGVIGEGSFEHTFETPGTYDYYCIPHRSLGMVGRVVVGEPGGPAEDSAIPDGSVPSSESIVRQGTVTAGGATGGDRSGGGTGPGMMDGGMGPGMMGGGGRIAGGSWYGVLPFVGGALGLLGLLGGALYWAAGRGRSVAGEDGDAAMAVLRERYARGELDEAEYRRRRERLEDGGTDRFD